MKTDRFFTIVIVGCFVFVQMIINFTMIRSIGKEKQDILKLQSNFKQLAERKKLEGLELQQELNNMESLKELNRLQMESDFRTIDTFITKLEMLKKFQDRIASGELQRAIESVVKESNRIKRERN